MRFLNLSIADIIPHSKTVWNFRQQIFDLELVDAIPNLFIKELKKLGLLVNKVKIIDATFVEVPKQPNIKRRISKYKVTTANVNDSKVIENILDEKEKGENFYTDIAYTGKKQNQIIAKKQMINSVNEKGYKANQLTDEEKLNNMEKSKIRARAEHFFGFMEKTMNQMYLQCIVFKRVNTSIG